MTTVITAMLCPPGPPAPGWVTVDGGRITAVGHGPAPSGHTQTENLGDSLLAPGFLDLQVNGVGDVDFARVDADGWRRAGRALLRAGTTGICPTIVTAPPDAYDPALERLGAVATASDAPALLGVHLEGPFLGGVPGAHPVELLRPADVAWTGELLDAHPGLVRLVTLAPEADSDLALTRMLRQRGVVVAIGHSTASYEQARSAADAGATVVTHLFNGMGPLHHREPGLAGAALDDPRLTPTLIADLVHVHPAALRLAIAAKSSVALVTDAVAVGSGTVGAAVTITERDGAARLADGTLAGSTLTLNEAVRNVVGLGVPVERAVEMASTVPAGVLGLTDRGSIVAGARADLVALDPVSLEVREVWLAGVLVYRDVASP